MAIALILFPFLRYEYRVEMIHHASPDSSKNIVREFGELQQRIDAFFCPLVVFAFISLSRVFNIRLLFLISIHYLSHL